MSAPEEAITEDTLLDALAKMPPRPKVQRVLVTRYSTTPDRCMEVEGKGWLLIHPYAWEELVATARPGDHAAKQTIYGLPVEHVPPGSDREREVARAIWDAVTEPCECGGHDPLCRKCYGTGRTMLPAKPDLTP